MRFVFLMILPAIMRPIMELGINDIGHFVNTEVCVAVVVTGNVDCPFSPETGEEGTLAMVATGLRTHRSRM